MPTTHVFIVNEQSFPIHLQYMFAGTGAGEATEHYGLLADINRVRVGDKVLFYLLAKQEKDGRFFGVFRIAEFNPLVIHDTGNSTYLEGELGKKLIYRVRVEPDEVYCKGVPEYEALDNLPTYSTEILWSLIYRKLKGIRGCTPITSKESKRLIEMITKKNNHKSLPINNKQGLSYDTSSCEIITGQRRKYTGATSAPSGLLNRIIYLNSKNRAFETELQCYFTENAGMDINTSLDEITGSKNEIEWFGNEVKCGVGMRSIDVFSVINHPREEKEFRIIELKDEHVQPSIVVQLFKYVNWTGQYISGAINANIQPIIVGEKIPENADGRRKYKKYDIDGAPSQYWTDLSSALRSFNNRNLAKPILYYEYSITNNGITFNHVEY